MGGRISLNKGSKDVIKLSVNDENTITKTQTEKLPYQIYGNKGCIMNNYIILFGGYIPGDYTTDILYYKLKE